MPRILLSARAATPRHVTKETRIMLIELLEYITKKFLIHYKLDIKQFFTK